MSIAIQGVKGSFHHKVAQTFFESNVSVLECMSFPLLVDQLVSGNATAAVMAIENSIAGAILPNYALIDQYKLTIEGEFYLDVQHNLMALSGQAIEAIKEVWSHPMALIQCRAFFEKYPSIKLVEATDTAAVAHQIQKEQLKGIAAIASETASQIYKLDIIAPQIQTIKHNETRFFILNTKEKQINTDCNKASICFRTDHKRGSLATILNVMSDCKLNLTKIQSMPVIEMPWQYAFFVDVTFEAYSDYEKAKKVLEIMSTDFKVLGEYKNQKR
ncbi:prephenate dehydratase [uncultured Dokdonia sp.]|uniref:prephenate dehydratase n=1 Tax=uncultured Dokdonia sp. TaxID=575653 RepID=UPI0026145F22|nr:prephenate dehydratase [uncultured Dokdonia sp.]